MREPTPFEQCKKAIEQLKVRKERCIKELKEINRLEKDIIFMLANPDMYDEFKRKKNGKIN